MNNYENFPVHEIHELVKTSVIGISIIYPLDRIGRNLLFEIGDTMFNKFMKKSENFYKNGNFQAVQKEDSYMFSSDVIIGTVPKDMNGVYIRNGPNPL